MAPGVLNCCFAVVRWLPVVFITAIIIWSYYAYVVQMCFFTVESIPEKVLYLLIFHPLLALFAWSYWQTIFTDPGTPTKQFYLSASEADRFEREENEDIQREMLARFARNLPVQCRTASGSFRYCEKCKCIKPDRAHHCSVCGTCILKMDHHCPWVNNCVCFTNYKFFVLFLGYGLFYCLFCAATSLQYFIRFWTSVSGSDNNRDMNNLHIVFLFFAGVMFAISLISLFGYHLWLCSKNRSTLESFRPPIFRSGPDKNGFSLGSSGNYQEIFGDNKKRWFLPVTTSTGDGTSFPTRVAQPPPSSYNSMDQSAPAPSSTTPEAAVEVNNVQSPPPPASFGDGVTYPIRTVDEDYDSLLGQRQRWMEEGEMDNSPGFYDNKMATMSNAQRT